MIKYELAACRSVFMKGEYMKNMMQYCVVISLLLLPVFIFAASPPDPSEQLKPFINRIVTQLKEPEFRKKPIKEQTSQLVQIVAEHFDFQEMSKRVMGKPWRTLSQDQRQEFVTLFTKLLQYVYIGQVDDYIDKKIEFIGQRIKGNRAEVKTLFVDAKKTPDT
ncbi:MAG: ABC transporter substrate-binding protein, partial [Candidatus Electrothrix sp. AR3]|nr:ABC transporter substrate-binding protein [Candidatus Electrothrix sp. AR3]